MYKNSPITDADRKLIADFLQNEFQRFSGRSLFLEYDVSQILNSRGEAAAEQYLLGLAKARLERNANYVAAKNFLARYKEPTS